MTTVKLSAQDKKDLEKFTKYLVYKSIQIIVQSRLGEKCRSASKSVSSGSDWFNLALVDLPEVLSETKRAWGTGGLKDGHHICIEMSLRTAEGENMVLETWSLVLSEPCDSAARVSHTVYNRMGLLLKSLIVVTRLAPAYSLSRKQGADSYVICYRVYRGAPVTDQLGEGPKSVNVGAVPTPHGTITLQVQYRTKLLFSPQPVSRDLVADLKDDHFMPDFSSQKTGPWPCHPMYPRTHRSPSMSEMTRTGSELELCAVVFSTSPQSLEASPGCGRGTPPHMLRAGGRETPPHSRPTSAARRITYDDTHSSSEKVLSLSNAGRMGAFAPVRETEATSDLDDIPFMSLLQPDDDYVRAESSASERSADTTDGVRHAEPMDTRSSSSSHKSSSESSGHVSTAEDYVLVELKTPFAGTDANSELGKFYRECQKAPALSMFDGAKSNPNVNTDDAINLITNQLAMFEANAKDFDEFVTTFTQGCEEEDQ